jgi:hypothetical protein
MRSVVSAGLFALASALAIVPSHADGIEHAHVSRYAHGILLSPAQTRHYHQCLTDGWIEEFCHRHGWGLFGVYKATVAECIAAQHHGRLVVNGRPPFLSNEAYCWAKAHHYPLY